MSEQIERGSHGQIFKYVKILHSYISSLMTEVLCCKDNMGNNDNKLLVKFSTTSAD